VNVNSARSINFTEFAFKIGKSEAVLSDLFLGQAFNGLLEDLARARHSEEFSGLGNVQIENLKIAQ
jgi:hypothetical protein